MSLSTTLLLASIFFYDDSGSQIEYVELKILLKI